MIADHQNPASGIRVSRFKVPSFVQTNGSAAIECWFELQGRERFYSLKWYFKDREFYRLYGKPPKNTPRRQTFPLEGVDIDSVSFNHHILFCPCLSVTDSSREMILFSKANRCAKSEEQRVAAHLI